MLGKVNHILNIVMGTCAGVFIGHGIYLFWDYRTYPDIYAMRPAPWYTSILVYGLWTTAALLAAVSIKLIIRRKLKELQLPKPEGRSAAH